MPSTTVRSAPLDTLRGLAALAVVAYHLGVPGGYLGVPVFFAISGYLIGSQLRAGRPLLTFTRARIARVVPLAWAVAIAGWALGYAGNAPLWVLLSGQVWRAWPGELLGVLWSLGVEEIAYLTAPAWVRSRHVVSIGLGVWAACTLASLTSGGGDWYTFPTMHMGHFALGVVGSVVRPPSAILWPVVLAAGVGCEAVVVDTSNAAWPLACPLAGAGGAALTVLAVRGDLPSWAPLSWCGVRCLGVYLLHPWVIELGAPWWAVVPVTCLAAEASWRLLERPARRALGGATPTAAVDSDTGGVREPVEPVDSRGAWGRG